MSRVGKNPVAIPAGVEVTQAGDALNVKGKLGSGSYNIPEGILVSLEGGKVTLTPAAKTTELRRIWGTTRNNVNNLVTGVSTGFTVKMEIQGVGYRAAIQGNELVMQLGFSHDVRFPIPEGITIKCEKPTAIAVSGSDKQRVGQTAAVIRAYKRPEPYKGKGIRYEGERVLIKEGKKK
jgi:large subunit ribosomal protein L6